MLTLNEVRSDLKEIRYYYSRKELFDKMLSGIGRSDVFDTVDKYNQAIRKAEPRLYDVYACLYVEGATQEYLASVLNYTPEYIRQLNKRLILYFQKQIEK